MPRLYAPRGTPASHLFCTPVSAYVLRLRTRSSCGMRYLDLPYLVWRIRFHAESPGVHRYRLRCRAALIQILRDRHYDGWISLDFNYVDMPPGVTIEQDMAAHRTYLVETLNASLNAMR